ncbi:flagellin lysine-N-methylase [uncultured Clostridium sp.]|uniref:flagellin lysine-N-methylase n=1 Tax=uncultured Clostridium sp. TaxID=59620 RepID=UPI0028EE139A|nr:flagellin lysine-N-methylase [uncultured Clostridium sp.]
MKILQPYYYDDFKCSANGCIDTCCQGWKIPIDKKTFLKYKKLKGEFGKEINKRIKRCRNEINDETYGELIKDEESKMCSFLTDEKLCGIYVEYGPEYMCNICIDYPRIIEKYRFSNNESIIERNLASSCPDVVRQFLNNERFSFTLKEEKINKSEIVTTIGDKGAEQFYNLLWQGRNFSIDIAQFREIPVWKRLVFIKITEEKLQSLIDTREFSKADDIIKSLRNEIIDPNVIDSLDKVSNINNIVKINLISSVIRERATKVVHAEKYREMVSNLNELINGKSDDELQLMLNEKRNEFDNYFKEKEHVLENYIVYYLYRRYMSAIKNKNLSKEIANLMINYSVIRLFLLATWNKNNGKLTDEDIVDAIYSFSREIEHAGGLADALYNSMKVNGYDSIGYLVTMIY